MFLIDVFLLFCFSFLKVLRKTLMLEKIKNHQLPFGSILSEEAIATSTPGEEHSAVFCARLPSDLPHN